jgi:hypothetical protein
MHVLLAKYQLQYRDLLAFAAVFAVVIGLVISRSMYSFGLLFMGLYWVSSSNRFSSLWRHPLYLLSLIIAFIPLISDFAKGSYFNEITFTKLSLPLFIQFFYVWSPTEKKLSLFNRSIIFIFFITSTFSILHFYKNYQENATLYTLAKVMNIGVYSDHIRLSVAIALSTIVAWFQFNHTIIQKEKYLVILYIVFQFIFLHILAARTGLIVLYVCNFTYILFLLFKKIKLYAIMALACLALLPIISFKIFPSFYNRIGITLYDFDYYKNMQYRQGSSDGFRYYSLLCGYDKGKENLAWGVGHCYMKNECINWFKDKFPAILDEEIIYPSSEYLYHFMMCGLIGLFLFICFSLSPFFIKKLRSNLYFFSIYLAVFITFFFEILLENQFGLGVVGLFIAWGWQICNLQTQETSNLALMFKSID